MIRHIALAVLLAAPTLSAQTAAAPKTQAKPSVPAPVPAALKPFQGTWVLTTPDGQPMSQSGELTIAITGDKYAQAIAGTINERGTIKLDATKKPMWMDLNITEGGDAGKLQVGLVEITAGVMKGALSFPGATTRPTSLAPGAEVIVFVAKKKA